MTPIERERRAADCSRLDRAIYALRSQVFRSPAVGMGRALHPNARRRARDEPNWRHEANGAVIFARATWR